MQWSLEGPQRARWAQEAKWWIPDADISKVVIPVQKLRYVLSHLRGMPQSEISYKLKLMQTERYRFTFQVLTTTPPQSNFDEIYILLGRLVPNFGPWLDSGQGSYNQESSLS